jgi:hypothetical protein
MPPSDTVGREANGFRVTGHEEHMPYISKKNASARTTSLGLMRWTTFARSMDAIEKMRLGSWLRPT